MLVGTDVARSRPLRHRTSRTLRLLVLSLLLAAPAALLAQAFQGPRAGADLGAPDRASVPALIPSQPHALPGDATNVRVDMTENDGLDVIVQAAGGGVSAPGVPDAAAVRFHQTAGSWEVDTGPGCAGPWTPVSANQTAPTASPVGGGLLTLCVASGSPTVRGTLTGLYNSAGQARSVNTLPLEQYVADTVPGGVAVELGRPGRCRPPGHELGLPGARGPSGGRPLLCPGQPGRLRRLRRHLRSHLPDLPRYPVRDGDERGRRQRHRRPGDGDARRSDRHHRILRVDGWLHLELQRGFAVHRRARRWRRGVRGRRLQPQPPMDDLGQLRHRAGRVAPDRHLHRFRWRGVRSGPSRQRGQFRPGRHHHARGNRGALRH